MVTSAIMNFILSKIIKFYKIGHQEVFQEIPALQNFLLIKHGLITEFRTNHIESTH